LESVTCLLCNYAQTHTYTQTDTMRCDSALPPPVLIIARVSLLLLLLLKIVLFVRSFVAFLNGLMTLILLSPTARQLKNEHLPFFARLIFFIASPLSRPVFIRRWTTFVQFRLTLNNE